MIDTLLGKYSRNGMIRAAGMIGILLNVAFAVLKLFVGLIANSIAILSDAINNLTDAISSIITLVGLKLSQKAPDQKHPLGYGRIEYLAGLIIASFVLLVGFEFLKTSIERIMHPENVQFTALQLGLLTVSLLGKLFLARLNTVVGKKANSPSLQASGTEAMIDVLTSGLTIVTAIVAMLTGWQIDGYAGLLLSLFILYSGIQLIKGTIGDILGERASKVLVDAVKNDLIKYEPILGAYDFIIHSYGPMMHLGSANLEFVDTLSIKDAYAAIYEAQQEILSKYQVYFTFGLYAVNTKDEQIEEMRVAIQNIICDTPHALTFHAFHVDLETQSLRFDVVVDFTVKDFTGYASRLKHAILVKYPNYTVDINIDLDYA